MIHTVFRAQRRAVALAFALLMVGGTLSAQEQQPAEGTQSEGTHTVKTGDTLWDLARAYLGDPFQWPEIYRINTDVVEDPHWIYPGEVLRIPGAVGETTVATEAEQPEAEAEAPVEASVGRAVPGSTVFSRSLGGPRGVYSRRGGIVGRELTTAVRPGEFYAAPWLDRSGGPGEAGRVIAPADMPGIARASNRPTLQPQDRVYVTLPKSIVPSRGDKLLLYRVGPQVEGHGQIVIPTAVVQVERAENADATTVRIVEQYDQVELGQGVLALERFNMPPDARPAPLALGTEARVIWIPSEAVLPSLQRYVVLTATNKDNVKQGDQFTLYRPRLRTERGAFLPEERIALVQVVKVTDRGVTGVIVDQAQPAIRQGTSARLTARMP
ncbi:MAG TPA: LysM peptidoglycan-binding domain-containing protein [Gemmatimonadaceae bacterium]|nr:LysM peptidoglycan-binding domain-containing protein [Gemmatimonadaceae bacterium]